MDIVGFDSNVFLYSIAGTGKGGNSIWGQKFNDEFDDSLRVSTKRYKIFMFILMFK